MKVKRMAAGLALGMSLVMSVNAFAAGSITGTIENVTADFSDAVITDEEGNAIDSDTLTLFVEEEFEAPYFATEEGQPVQETIDAVNDGTALSEAVTDLTLGDDVEEEEVDDLSLLTPVQAVVIRDEDGNIIENAKNVKVSFELTNIPDKADIYVLLHNATDGWSLHKVKSGSVLGDSAFADADKKAGSVLGDAEYATLNGSKLTLLFTDIKGAAFGILYKTAEASTPTGGNDATNTGDFGRTFPAVIAVLLAGGAVASVYRKKNA